jgi:hypothetical protein
MVCLMQMLPLHLHLHHGEDSGAPGAAHALDVHIADTVTDQKHLADAHIIDLSTETIIKSPDSTALIPLLLFSLLSVFFLATIQRRLPHPESADRPPQLLFRIFSPLRAPPR